MNYAQVFCTVSDLIADTQASGVDDVRMYQAICEASDYLQKEIGWFIPVTLTRKFDGKGKQQLFLPPFLAVSSIVNDDVTLSAADYLLKPDDGFWINGPYGQIHVAPDATLLSYWHNEKDGVEIAGRWGKYERSGATGATVQETASQSDSQGTLKVSDGGKVSPGMVLLIGSEQELVTGWSDPTEAVTTLNGLIAATAEIITLTNGTLVNKGELLRIGFEQIFVKDKRGHQCSVIRGWNGTARVEHADDAEVDVYRTVTVGRAVNGTTAASHLKDVEIGRYFAPDDIQFLTREIATLMVNKAKGGYQGRTGNADLGVVFYNDAFPKADIERVKSIYSIPNAR